MTSFPEIRKCRLTPKEGGYSRPEANRHAESLGLIPGQYRNKPALCDAMLEALTQNRDIVLTNKEVKDRMFDLVKMYNADGETYRASGIRKGIELFANFPELNTLPTNGRVTALQEAGIGERIADRILEAAITGSLHELGDLNKETNTESIPEDVFDFTSLFGFGPAKAYEILTKGISTYSELVDVVSKGEIQVTPMQRLGLDFTEDFKERIPREEVARIGKIVLSTLAPLDRDLAGEVVGSFRRGNATSGDVDILISSPENRLPDMILALQRIGLIERVVSFGNVKFAGTYWSNYLSPESPGGRNQNSIPGILRHIDIRWVPMESWPSSLLHSTGPDTFNIIVRKKAIEQGLLLSEHGLFRNGEKIPLKSESEILNYMGIPFIPPSERTGTLPDLIQPIDATQIDDIEGNEDINDLDGNEEIEDIL